MGAGRSLGRPLPALASHHSQPRLPCPAALALWRCAGRGCLSVLCCVPPGCSACLRLPQCAVLRATRLLSLPQAASVCCAACHQVAQPAAAACTAGHRPHPSPAGRARLPPVLRSGQRAVLHADLVPGPAVWDVGRGPNNRRLHWRHAGRDAAAGEPAAGAAWLHHAAACMLAMQQAPWALLLGRAAGCCSCTVAGRCFGAGG